MTGAADPKKPWPLKVGLAILGVVVLVKAFDLIVSLWHLPSFIGRADVPAWILAQGGLDLLITIAVLALAVSVWRSIRRRVAWGRWGLLLLITLSMGRCASNMPIDGAAFSSNAEHLGAITAVLVPWAFLLLVALFIIFSDAVKRYFVRSP